MKESEIIKIAVGLNRLTFSVFLKKETTNMSAGEVCRVCFLLFFVMRNNEMLMSDLMKQES